MRSSHVNCRDGRGGKETTFGPNVIDGKNFIRQPLLMIVHLLLAYPSEIALERLPALLPFLVLAL